VLAGGRSTRFGSNKLRVEYRGAPLLHHAVARLAEVSEEVVVVLSPDGPEPTMPAGVSVRFTRDTTDGEGPLAGLYAGLMASRTELVLVAGGDMPDLQPALLREMLRVAREEPADAVALADGGRLRPLPCALRMLEALDATHTLLHIGGRRLRSMLEALQPVVIDEAAWIVIDPARGTLFDVDERSDLDPT
jgi:molybdopterin-guanine dinucleotide biosynthesis protein A